MEEEEECHRCHCLVCGRESQTRESFMSWLFSAYCMMSYARHYIHHWLMDALIIQMYFPTGFEYQRIVLYSL